MVKTVVIVAGDPAMRLAVSHGLRDERSFEVTGKFADSDAALASLEREEPGILVLDAEIDGDARPSSIERVRAKFPTLPVVLFGKFSADSSTGTFEAIGGRTSYVVCPGDLASSAARAEFYSEHILPALHSFSDGAPAPPPPLPSRPKSRVLRPEPRKRAVGALRAVAIGCSTGGPSALSTVVSALPADFPIPVLVVQHMPPTFTEQLAARLDTKSSLSVSEAKHGERVEPGHVYIAPGGQHMAVERTDDGVRIALNGDPPEHGCRPAVDPLFRSAVDLWGDGLLVAVLTGMGQDGTSGAHLVREHGGTVLVQDEATSVVWGMPGSIAQSGGADEVLCPEDIARALVARARGVQA